MVHLCYIMLLVGGFKHFSIMYGIIIPIDQYVSRLLKPPTSLIYAFYDQVLNGLIIHW